MWIYGVSNANGWTKRAACRGRCCPPASGSSSTPSSCRSPAKPAHPDSSAGGAIWREAVEITDETKRRPFLDETMPGRLQTLIEIATGTGTSWKERPSHAYSLADVPEDWYIQYQGFRT